MKFFILSVILFVLNPIQIAAQCKNLNFQDIYSLWTAYNNRSFEDSLTAKGGEKFDKSSYGICYSLLEESKEDSVYMYNEAFQVDDIVRFTYMTVKKMPIRN